MLIIGGLIFLAAIGRGSVIHFLGNVLRGAFHLYLSVVGLVYRLWSKHFRSDRLVDVKNTSDNFYLSDQLVL